MNIALILFVIGVIMVVAGYMVRHHNSELKRKIVPRNVYDDILYNQELYGYNDMV